MKAIKNNRGMTLMEVLISLVIASIVMVIAGSILLSSMSMYDQQASETYNKSILDNAFKLIEEEMKYAGAVEIRDDKMDAEATKEYSYFKIDEGRLIYNGLEVYNKEQYANNTLKMQCQKKDKGNLYLNLSINKNGETLLERNTTIIYDNILLVENEEIIEGESKVYENSYIYFKKPKIAIEPDSFYTGTVADQIECMTTENNRGDFDITFGIYYNHGDFVLYQGAWYRFVFTGATMDGSTTTPGKIGQYWKKIDKYWNEWAYYLKDDVIIYLDPNTKEEVYFKSKIDINFYPPLEEHAWTRLKDAPLKDAPVCK